MVTRCISALNELDKVSQKISHKHSQKRFQANAEAKLKLAQEKVNRALQECERRTPSSLGKNVNTTSNARQKREKGPPSSPSLSTYQRHSRLEGMTRFSRSVGSASETKNHMNRERTKSCSNCRTGNSPDGSKTGPVSLKDFRASSINLRPVSIYGRHMDGESKYKPEAWFNFTKETSMGVIDSFACDANNLKALCYTVDRAQGKGVPKLLRHRLKVRIGQNGVVRGNVEGEPPVSHSESVMDRNSVEQGTPLNVKKDKKRVAPLSWDEQVNWENVQSISQKSWTTKDPQRKGLCETRPVIFHPKQNAKRESDEVESPATGYPRAKSPAYRMYLETRTSSADRRNLVASPERFITTVGVEDTREDGNAAIKKEGKSPHDGSDCEGTDEDRMSSAMDNWYNLPRRNSEKIDKEMPLKQVTELRSEKVSKKVSFEDERRKGVEHLKEDGVSNTGQLSERVLTRPRTSRERLQTTRDFAEFPPKPTRPCTAPPSSPRLRHGKDVEEVSRELLLPTAHHLPVRIPISRLESCDAENSDREESEIKATEDKREPSCEGIYSDVNGAESNESSSEKEELKQSTHASKIRVSFAPMSAPAVRVSEREEDRKALILSKSTTLLRRKVYSPPPPVVIYSQSSLELPKGLPPAEALIALRKKIREDLEQQNRDLQLDIQQLYLRGHSEDA